MRVIVKLAIFGPCSSSTFMERMCGLFKDIYKIHAKVNVESLEGDISRMLKETEGTLTDHECLSLEVKV